MKKDQPKIIISESRDFSNGVIEMLKEHARVDVRECSYEDLPYAFKEYDVFWFRLAHPIDDNILNGDLRCKFIVTPVTGLDHIDIELCNEKGIQVISLNGETEFLKNVRATAELTVALTLALYRNIIPAAESVLKGEWKRDLFRGHELYGKTAGIIGVGRLGKIVAGYFKAFGMNLIGYDIADEYDVERMKKADSIEELLEKSDIVSLHVNYNEETKHLISENEFSYFKNDSILINTSRGGVIDEKALLAALEKNKIMGAALDVVQDEFNFSEDNLLVEYANRNNNLLIIPHIGGNTYESFEKTERFLAEKLIDRLKTIN